MFFSRFSLSRNQSGSRTPTLANFHTTKQALQCQIERLKCSACLPNTNSLYSYLTINGHTIFLKRRTGTLVSRKKLVPKKVFTSNQLRFLEFRLLKTVFSKKEGLYFESVSNFWQTGQDKAPKIGAVPPKSGRMVSLTLNNEFFLL